jgi:protease-4
MVSDGFKWFVGLVETRRGVKAADIPGLLEGRIFSGREALQAKLVDEIGGEEEAVKWLKTVKGVPQNAKVTDWKPSSGNTYGFAGMSAGIAGWLFGPAAADATNFLLRDRTISTLGLDGLLSVWHPSEK